MKRRGKVERSQLPTSQRHYQRKQSGELGAAFECWEKSRIPPLGGREEGGKGTESPTWLQKGPKNLAGTYHRGWAKKTRAKVAGQ